MPSVIVLGCGRSGTNMTLEILRGNPYFNASKPSEVKDLFNGDKRIPDKYLTKCDTCYFNIDQLMAFMNRNSHTRAFFTIRDPRDMAMSKLRRGVPVSEGGDCAVLADDATPSGLFADIKKTSEIIREAMNILPFGRRSIIHMENTLRGVEAMSRWMCEFIGIPYHSDMPNFPERIRVKEKRKRYDKVDKGQVALWKNWETAYDGWLKDRFDMPAIFKSLENITQEWGYEL